MGWQKRSSGNRYDSLSGHAFTIGANSKKNIYCMVSSKMCATCQSAEANGTIAREHKCPKNYSGSSKAMEADAALESYVSLFRENEGTIAFSHVIADDDSSMRAILRHPQRNGKGKLPEEIPAPEWYCDPSHRTKVVAKPFFALAIQPKSVSEATNVDAGRIKKWYAYMIRDNRDKSFEQLKRAAEAVILHLFGIHTNCDEKWCRPLRIQNQKQALPLPEATKYPAAMEGQEDHPPSPSSPAPSAGSQTSSKATVSRKSYEVDMNPTDTNVTKEDHELEGYYRCKTKNAKLYKQFTKIYRQFTSEERLRECMHPYDTQLNEAMNTSVHRYAPKGRTYCSTMSLTNRVMIALGVRNAGYYGYWSRVFAKMKLPMSPNLEAYLKNKDKKKKRKRNYESSLERRIKRAKIRNDKMKEEIQKQMKDSKQGATYGAGVAIETISNLPSFVVSDDQELKGKKSQKCPFVGCTGTNHKTNGSKSCVYHHCNTEKELIEAMKNYLKRKYPSQYGECKRIINSLRAQEKANKSIHVCTI